jgi:hypothetical protein
VFWLVACISTDVLIFTRMPCKKWKRGAKNGKSFCFHKKSANYLVDQKTKKL